MYRVSVHVLNISSFNLNILCDDGRYHDDGRLILSARRERDRTNFCQESTQAQ